MGEERNTSQPMSLWWAPLLAVPLALGLAVEDAALEVGPAPRGRWQPAQSQDGARPAGRMQPKQDRTLDVLVAEAMGGQQEAPGFALGQPALAGGWLLWQRDLGERGKGGSLYGST